MGVACSCNSQRPARGKRATPCKAKQPLGQGEIIDAILAKLETCLEEVKKPQVSQVKTDKVKRELLGQIGIVGDFIKEILVDQQRLHCIFHDGVRLVRIEDVLTVVCSYGQNAADWRVTTCLQVVESVKKLLLQSTITEDRLARPGRRDLVPEILATSDLELLARMEPNKEEALVPWMIWMVHRAHLNDPALVTFDFTCLTMPSPIESPQAGPDSRAALVAPKLAKAIATNTHITFLSLSCSNLQGAEGQVLGMSLASNCSIRILNLESNMLAPDDMTVIMQGLAANRTIEEVRCSNQVKGQIGQCRNDALESLLLAVQKNTRLVKVGICITEPHYRNVINRQIMQNLDLARQRRCTTVAADSSPLQYAELSMGWLERSRNWLRSWAAGDAASGADDVEIQVTHSEKFVEEEHWVLLEFTRAE